MLTSCAANREIAEIIAHIFIKKFAFAAAIKVVRVFLIKHSTAESHIFTPVNRETMLCIFAIKDEISGYGLVVLANQIPVNCLTLHQICKLFFEGLNKGARCKFFAFLLKLLLGNRSIKNVVLLISEVPTPNAVLDALAVETKIRADYIGAILAKSAGVCTGGIYAFMRKFGLVHKKIVHTIFALV